MSRAATILARECNLEQVTAVLTGILSRHGGLTGFLRDWTAWWQQTPPGSAARQRALSAVHNLMRVAIEAEAAKEQAHREQDRELSEQRRQEFGKMTDYELDEVVAQGLRRRGWTVRRPSSCKP